MAWNYGDHAADAMVDRNIDTLTDEVVDDRQALQAAAVSQRIAKEVHAPHRIGRSRRLAELRSTDHCCRRRGRRQSWASGCGALCRPAWV